MRRIKVLIIFLICILLTGCINRKQGERNVSLANTAQNQLNYKQDVFSEQGKTCAFYNGRIYCFMNDSKPGIYSVDTDKKKRELKVAVENIRKLQVTDDGIYYTAPKNDKGEYSLFYKAWEGESKEYFTKEVLIGLEHDLNVWDFYVGKDGLVTIVEIYARIPKGLLSFRSFIVGTNMQIIPLADYEDYLVDFNASEDQDGICVSGYQDIIFTTGAGFKDRAEDQNKYTIDLDERNMTIFNSDTNELLLMRNQAIYYDVYFDGIVQTIFEDNFIISSKNSLYWVMQNSSEPSCIIELPEVQEIRFSVPVDDMLLVVGANEKGEEYLYEINLTKAEVQHTIAIELGQEVIAIDNGCVYTVTKKAVYVYEIKNGNFRQIGKQKWERDLKKSSKLEMAGDTIFTYNVSDRGKNAGEFVYQEAHTLN